MRVLAKQVDALSRECYLVTEKLIVDVIVVNASQSTADLASAEATLEALQAIEVYPYNSLAGSKLCGFRRADSC